MRLRLIPLAPSLWGRLDILQGLSRLVLVTHEQTRATPREQPPRNATGGQAEGGCPPVTYRQLSVGDRNLACPVRVSSLF